MGCGISRAEPAALEEPAHAGFLRRRKVLFVHGAMKGGATEIAEGLAGRLRAEGVNLVDGLPETKVDLDVEVVVGNECNMEIIAKSDCLVVVLSTAENGRPPENFDELFVLLKQKARTDRHLPLADTPHALMGFGSSVFGDVKFVKAPREVDDFLVKLGSPPIMEPFLHDDRGDNERDVDALFAVLEGGLTSCFRRGLSAGAR